MKDLSIIVPCFNKWNFTKHCLESLLKLDPKIDIEIIIADDAGTDETSEAIKHYLSDDRITYLRSETNKGFAANCNWAYKHSSGKTVLFLNNDIKIKDWQTGWIKVVLAFIEKFPSAIMGPLGGFVDPTNNFIFAYETGDPNRKINYISGFCLWAARKVFDNLIINDYNGPFSEEFGRAYFEDTDLGFRAKEKGYELKLVDLPIQHIGRISTSQINAHKLYNEARQVFVKKWKGHT